jgi:hypothetical protein
VLLAPSLDLDQLVRHGQWYPVAVCKLLSHIGVVCLYGVRIALALGRAVSALVEALQLG